MSYEMETKIMPALRGLLRHGGALERLAVTGNPKAFQDKLRVGFAYLIHSEVYQDCLEVGGTENTATG